MDSIRETYKDPRKPESFGGINALYRIGEKKVSKSKIGKWLESNDAYTLHKPVKKTFKRNRVIVSHIDQQWQADLVDLGN